jgi:hypothetical protein
VVVRIVRYGMGRDSGGVLGKESRGVREVGDTTCGDMRMKRLP